MRRDVINLSIKLGCIFILMTVLFATTYYQNAELAKELLDFEQMSFSAVGNVSQPEEYLALFR